MPRNKDRESVLIILTFIIFAKYLNLSKWSTTDEQSFALVSNILYCIIGLWLLVFQNRDCYHVSSCTACSAQSLLWFHEHIGDILNQQKTTFYSHKIGRCSTISSGLASAAMIMSSVIPRLRVLVASLAPFFICLSEAHCETKS